MTVKITTGYEVVGEGPYSLRLPTTFVDITNATAEERSKWEAIFRSQEAQIEKMKVSLSMNFFAPAEEAE